MRRCQLFEFLDQSWLPDRLRVAATGYLTASYATTPFPARWAGILARVLDDCGLDRIIDIGSGSGGPIEAVLAEMAKLGRRPLVTLTDLYPVRTASSIDYWPEPVSATCVPAELRGLRTLFLVFHHFTPPMAQAVLQDAFNQRQPICIFEATSRTAPAIAVSFVLPFLVLLLTPFVRPKTVFQLFFTYLIPVVPLLVFWDGLVSQLRTYSTAELRELTAFCDSPEFVWEHGFIEESGVPFKTCYLIGRPKLVSGH
jgi:hypothetical protein